MSKLNGYFAERVHGMTVVQLFGAQATSRAEFAALGEAYAEANRRSNWWDAGLYAIMDGMSALAVGLLIWYGADRVFEPQSGVTLGLIVAFVDYLNKVFVPIREFSGNLATLQRSTAALERVFGLLDTREAVGQGVAVFLVCSGVNGGVDPTGPSSHAAWTQLRPSCQRMTCPRINSSRGWARQPPNIAVQTIAATLRHWCEPPPSHEHPWDALPGAPQQAHLTLVFRARSLLHR